MRVRGLLFALALTVLVCGQSSAGTIVSDPGLRYSTYAGGAGFEMGLGVAVDAAGNTYMTGRTESADYQTTPNAVGTTFRGGTSDVFVSKFGPGGNLVYSTYLGGSGEDEGRGIAVDTAGSVYVDGFTDSTDFPTVNAVDGTANGGRDAFVAKIGADGALVWSTYLGGSGEDKALALTLDSSGNAYVTGEAEAGFPSTAGVLDTTQNGDVDAFVAKLSASGSLGYSTFLGGPAFDDGLAIAVDGSGDAFVTGKASPGFPVTAGAFDVSQNGGYDMFVAKLDPSGSAAEYCTYLGGDSWDEGLGIAVDAGGNAYVTGNVQSRDFPTSEGAYNTAFQGAVDAGITKLNAAGSALVYSLLLGGSGWIEGDGLAVDRDGNAYVSGHLVTPDLPTTAGSLQPTAGGGVDGFLAKVAPTGADLLYATYVGGSGWDGAMAMTIDGNGNAYLTGASSSSDYPVTANAFATNVSGGFDAIATTIATTAQPPPPAADFTLTADRAEARVVKGESTSLTVTIVPTDRFSADVSLAVSGLPSSASATFAPNPARSSSTLTISTATSTPPGGYTLTVTGTSGSLSRTTSVQLVVHCCQS